MHYIKALLVVVLTGLYLALAGCTVNPVTGKRQLALFQISTDQEIELGKKAFPAALQQMGGEYPDPDLNAYVNEVGTPLGRLSHRPDLPYEFKVVNDSSPNAFALPGGFIAITRGLLVNLENEAQLAAVLGHEVGHVAAMHSVQGMQRGSLLNLALAVLSEAVGEKTYGGLAQKAGQLAANLLDKSYSREQEREADRLGIDYMVAGGFNPQGAVQLQEFFYRKLEGGAEPMWLSGLFRTHPFSKERLLANEDYILMNYPNTSNDPAYVLRPQSFQAAVSELKKVERGYALYDEARSLEAKGDAANAISLYLQAAAEAPDEALILSALGMAYLRADDLQSARMHLGRAINLDDKYYQSHMGLGYIHLKQGENSRAVKELEASMQLLPNIEGAFLLAEGYEKTGRSAEAMELYRAVSEADPSGKLGRAAAERIRALEGS